MTAVSVSLLAGLLVPERTLLVVRMRAAGPLTSCPVLGGQSLQPTQSLLARLLL